MTSDPQETSARFGPPFPLLASDAMGPLSMMPPRLALRVMQCARPLTLEAGILVVQQYHRAGSFFFLLQGHLEFHISLESAEHEFPVGQTATPWTPIGWSAFRAPHRYATSVRTTTRSRLLEFSLSRLEQLFLDEPDTGRHFFEMVGSTARTLLHEARERLLSNLRLSTTISHWKTPEDSSKSAPQHLEMLLAEAERSSPHHQLPMEARIPSEESMVQNAAPHPEEILSASGFFEDLSDEDLKLLGTIAKTEYFCRGDLITRQGIDSADFLVLADGRLRVEYSSESGRTAVLGFLRDRGEVAGSGLLPKHEKNDVSIRATRDGSLLRFDRRSLLQLFDDHPGLGLLFHRRGLWLLGRRLRGARARLVSEEFDQEVVAVENLIEQARTELRVSSELHKLPHLLKAPVTLVDALRVVDCARRSEHRVERHIAKLAHELLLPVRREQRFFSALQATFEDVVGAPPTSSPEELRRICAESFTRVFSQIPYRVEGWEQLPPNAGHIFIFNHLKNHEYNTLPNGFQLTLDAHFITAMILHPTYRDPGVRVVRQSRAGEYGHHAYYERLGHVTVYTRESDDPGTSRGSRFDQFLKTASDHLQRGTNLVLAPEGTSLSTEESPGPFKAGAFRLAAALRDEPWIVPIAVAHFDRRLDHTTLGAVINAPFRISERVENADDPAQMRAFLAQLRKDYRLWVEEAAWIASPRRSSELPVPQS